MEHVIWNSTVKRVAVVALAIAMSLPISVLAAPGDKEDTEEIKDVTVDNWQTWYPKVTALRSLNAYLATEKGEQVYYVPTLEELPNIKNAVSDCKDYHGDEKKFATVYDGYFDQMCREALVRKSDGTYSKVPAIVQTEGSNSVRELTTLGYDLLLTNESISNIQTSDTGVSVSYNTSKIDRANGFVDLNTALMDIYKAVGQSKYDIAYMFTSDPTLTVESSPIQEQINLLLSKSQGIDTSDGKAWVFVTRTNPILYWKQAAYDGVIWDAEALGTSKVAGASNTKDEQVSLAEFCEYAYNIMNIYGEPVMTQAEKNILLQLYGSTVPYKACTDGQVKAIESFIAKGIISPEDDQNKLQWNANIDYDYMLTLLMRINDVNARTTYKDVQITMDASMIKNGYYNAKLEHEDSNIVDLSEAKSAVRVTNYYDVLLSAGEFENMAQTIGMTGVSTDLFIPAHLVFTTEDGAIFPINTQVTAYTQKIYSKNYPDKSYVLSNYNVVSDGPLMQFCSSEGMITQNSVKFLQLKIAAFTVDDLICDDGTYHLQLIDDKGELSSSIFRIQPGGGVYYTSGVKSDEDSHNEEETVSLSNQKEIDELISLYDDEGESAAQKRLRELERNNTQWTTAEIEAAEYAASSGEQLSSITSTVVYMEIRANSESNIMVTSKKGVTRKLSDIMSGTEHDGVYYVDENDAADLAFRKINNTHYQVENCAGRNDLTERVKSSSVGESEMAYCYQDKELMVSTSWLKNKGLIVTDPNKNNDILMLTTKYSNIYLDKKNNYIVVGSCVYDVKGNEEGQVWFETADGDVFVNFRAVLGWTGNYTIYKNVGGSISVVINRTITGSVTNVTMSKRVDIRMNDVTKNINGNVEVNDNNVSVLRLEGRTSNTETDVPMTSMYPFVNWFIYISPNVVWDDESVEYHDWLFVFKPREIKVDGAKIEYDDTESRKQLHDTINMDVKGLDDSVRVWAYPLYRNNKKDSGMPAHITYDSQWGYVYNTPNIDEFSSMTDMLKDYFDYTKVMQNTGTPKCAIPLYVDGDGATRCFNYNTYTYTDSSGDTVMMNYGELPLSTLSHSAGDFKRDIYTQNADGTPVLKQAQDDLDNCYINPTITSPALWFLELQKFKLDTVMSTMNNGSGLYWGTSKVTLETNGNEKKLKIGLTDVTKTLNDPSMQFMLMRETSYDTSTIGRWYSVSALTAFKLESVVDGDGTENMVGPPVGESNAQVDSIDWNGFKLSRMLESGEFAVSVVTIVALFILPRIALFCFLLLAALSVIQNVKIVQLFCDRIFDPYKFLTAGRRDVHTFQGTRSFIASIVAMAIFAIFMDGTIIRVYEWIMRFIGVFLGK